jgi:GAF domain-containing protein
MAQQTLYDSLLNEAISATGADKGTLQLLDRSVNGLRLVASRGFGPPFLQFFATIQVGEACVCSSALRQAGRVIVPNVTTSEIFKGAPNGEVLRNAGVRSMQSTPIFNRGRRLIGMVSTHWTSEHQPSDEELARLDMVVLRAARQIASG